jgi:hypothetical protein
VPHYLSIDMRVDKMASTLVFVFSFALFVYAQTSRSRFDVASAEITANGENLRIHSAPSIQSSTMAPERRQI